MCGRYVRRTPLQNVMDLFSAVPERGDLALKPSFNVSPTQDAPVVRMGDAGSRTIALLRWGFVPSWADDPAIGNKMINARAETVADKSAYRRAFEQRRCIVPADGFYEWKKEGASKTPYYIHRADEQPIAFAGLWERWQRDDRVIESFTILTTSPNQLMRSIHDRMPVVIAPKNYALWLDRRSDPNVLLPLLEAQDDSALVATPVGDLVNNPRNDVPDCIEPLAAEPPGHTLF